MVTIYGVSTVAFGFTSEGEKTLKRLAEETGGRAEYPLQGVYKDVSGYLSTPSDEGNYALRVGTGGYAAAIAANIVRAVAAVAGEITTQYVLRYVPDEPDSPKAFRNIEVRVNLPNVKVRHRKGLLPARRLKPGQLPPDSRDGRGRENLSVSVMPAPAKAPYWVLGVALPGRPPAPAGVLLLDESADRLHLELRSDWRDWAAPEDAEVLELLAADLASQAEQMGAARLIALLEDRLSNALRSPSGAGPWSPISAAPCTGSTSARSKVCGRPAPVIPFRTHLPVYSLRAAAGKFGPEQDVDAEPEDWIPVPLGLRPSPDYFACHVLGRSMEPRIPDGEPLPVSKHPGRLAPGQAGAGAAPRRLRRRRVHREALPQREDRHRGRRVAAQAHRARAAQS